MNGPLARFVARTCHANAFLRWRPVPEFSHENSTCQFCDSVKFFKVSKTLLRIVRETPVAANPNAWFEHLRTERVTGIRLSCTPQNKPGISDHVVGIRWRRRDLGNGSPPTTRQVRRLAVPMGGSESKRAGAPGLAGIVWPSFGDFHTRIRRL